MTINKPPTLDLLGVNGKPAPFPVALRELREACGMTQHDAATWLAKFDPDRFGAVRSYQLSRWERDAETPAAERQMAALRGLRHRLSRLRDNAARSERRRRRARAGGS